MDFNENLTQYTTQALKRCFLDKSISCGVNDANDNSDGFEPGDNIFSYPCSSIYKELGRQLNKGLTKNHMDMCDLPKFFMLEELGYESTREQLADEVLKSLKRAESLWHHWSEDEKVAELQLFLKSIGKRGILDIIGVRHTAGSIDEFLPSKESLIKTFQEQNHEKSILTVGARALAKHSHRDGTSSWWGICTGTESAKNDHALKVVNKILDDAHWINIHHLPGDVQTVEIRSKEGYGARWTSDGKTFRGFLEPMFEGGHDVGWRH